MRTPLTIIPLHSDGESPWKQQQSLRLHDNKSAGAVISCHGTTVSPPSSGRGDPPHHFRVISELRLICLHELGGGGVCRSRAAPQEGSDTKRNTYTYHTSTTQHWMFKRLKKADKNQLLQHSEIHISPALSPFFISFRENLLWQL